MCAGRNRVVGRGLASVVADDDLRMQIFLVLDDDHGLLAGGFVRLLLHGDAFKDVVELHLAGLLGQDRHVVRVPLDEDFALLDLGAIRDGDDRTDNDSVLLQLALVVGEDGNGAVLVEDDVVLAVFECNQAQLVVVHSAVVFGLDLRHLEHRGSGAADVERAHGELRARLADGLRGDDAGGFAQFHPGARGQVAAIAIDTHPALAFAGQHRTDLDLLDVRVVDEPGLDLVHLLVRLGKQLLRLLRIRDVVARKAAHEAVAQLDHLVFAFVDSLDPDAVGRAAIFLTNNHVLRHIHQLAGHVTRVGGLERGVGQTFAGAVGRDEVLKHCEALAEVGENRLLDDVAGRFGHEPAHAGELADLLPVAARARIDHERGLYSFLPWLWSSVFNMTLAIWSVQCVQMSMILL